MRKLQPKLVITRHRLSDGYSDEILGMLKEQDQPSRVIVLAAADCSTKDEARHLSLGADAVLRDPLRIQVLLELAARYRGLSIAAKPESSREGLGFDFAGTHVLPHERTISRAGRKTKTSPRVIGLLQILHRAEGRVVSYESLFPDLFGRPFNGDTANSRVLLAKADREFRGLGVNLRKHLKVIPKSGYLYAARGPADR